MPFQTCQKCIQLCPERHHFHVRKGGNFQISIGGRPCRIIEGAEGKGSRRTVRASVSTPHCIKVNMKTKFACLYLGCFWCTDVCEGDTLIFYFLKELGLSVGLFTTVPLTSAEVLFYTLKWAYPDENPSASSEINKVQILKIQSQFSLYLVSQVTQHPQVLHCQRINSLICLGTGSSCLYENENQSPNPLGYPP